MSSGWVGSGEEIFRVVEKNPDTTTTRDINNSPSKQARTTEKAKRHTQEAVCVCVWVDALFSRRIINKKEDPRTYKI
jgi:hypothetical protein